MALQGLKGSPCTTASTFVLPSFLGESGFTNQLTPSDINTKTTVEWTSVALAQAAKLRESFSVESPKPNTTKKSGLTAEGFSNPTMPRCNTATWAEGDCNKML
eukprot:CAMPEP_0184440702 /NCGR_PEP_ID=MMETSP0738-20130409/755707_1 /TAXON_ID=385413 /ORGANISM="Thalassiosira miniscula, Strain CCMP1093" /LENGTH=102 /DNA_ID=CAMNT_0026808609 /DNA_START=913 /DNA_END=1221 /DNA_ORIENTATION=+